MKKKIKNIILWSLLLVYLIVSFSFINSEKLNERCTKVNIKIDEKQQHYFIEKSEIEATLEKSNRKLLGAKLDSININNIETSLLSNPSILKCEVFLCDNSILNIEIIQRNPILRVLAAQKSFYIDDTGTIMPLSENYSARVVVINGNIPNYKKFINGENIIIFNDTNKLEKLMYDIFNLSQFIYNDEFWNAQISQIYINENYEFELIPRVGDHIIVFGGIEDYEQKFNKIKTLYLKGFNNLGWSNYKEINLKYKNQVVCKKRLNYEGRN